MKKDCFRRKIIYIIVRVNDFQLFERVYCSYSQEDAHSARDGFYDRSSGGYNYMMRALSHKFSKVNPSKYEMERALEEAKHPKPSRYGDLD